jgi:hypothetical protein
MTTPIKAGDTVWTAEQLSVPPPGHVAYVTWRHHGVDGRVQHVDEQHQIAIVLHHLKPATVGIYHLHELSLAVADQEQPPLHVRKRADAGEELRQLQLERDLARGHQANPEAQSRRVNEEVLQLRARVEELDRRLCQIAHLDELATAEEAVEQIAARCQLYDLLADPEAYDCADPETLASQAVRALRRATEAQSELTGLRSTLMEITGVDVTGGHDPGEVLERLRYLVAALEPLWELDRGLLSQAQESLEQIGRWRELDAEETRDALRGLGGAGDSSPHHTAARLAEVCELLLQVDRAARDSSPVRRCRPGASLEEGEEEPAIQAARAWCELDCRTQRELRAWLGDESDIVATEAHTMAMKVALGAIPRLLELATRPAAGPGEAVVPARVVELYRELHRQIAGFEPRLCDADLSAVMEELYDAGVELPMQGPPRRGEPDPLYELQRGLLECLAPAQLERLACGLRALVGRDAGAGTALLVLADYLEHLAGEAS